MPPMHAAPPRFFWFIGCLLTGLTFSPAFSHPPLPPAAPGTISRLVQSAQPGQTIELPPGIYRGEHIVFPRSGTVDRPIVLRAARPGTVIVRGSQVIRNWEPVAAQPGTDRNLYRHPRWPHAFAPHEPGSRDARGLPRNQLFMDGVLLREVTRQNDLAPGHFLIDPDQQAIYLQLRDGAHPSDHLIEAADTAGPLLTTNGQSHIRVEGIIFQHGANRPQDHALVQIAGGDHCEVLDCRVEWAAGAGISIRGEDHVVQRCHFNHNGQLGLHSAGARRCRVLDTQLAYNNTHPGKTFDPQWEAGGCKITRSRDFDVRRVHAHHNLGSGIWFDLDNRRAAIIDCVSHHNGHGIHYEISYTAEIRGNLCFNNQMQGQPKNSPSGQGIYLSSSAGCIVSHNITFHNATRGIEVFGPIRDDGEGRQITSHSNQLIHNVVFDNQRANPSMDIILGYGSSLRHREPPVLVDSLLPVAPNTADHNRYHRDDDHDFFLHPDGRAQTLEQWQRISGQDAHSLWAPPEVIPHHDCSPVP